MGIWGFFDYSLFKPGCQFIIFSMSWLHKPNRGEFNFTMNSMTTLLTVQPVSSASEKSDLPPQRQIINQGAGEDDTPSTPPFSINHGDLQNVAIALTNRSP